MKVGKWKWIENKTSLLSVRCSDKEVRVKLRDLCVIAHDIESALKEVYSNTLTYMFEEDMNKIEEEYNVIDNNNILEKLKHIRLIANISSYCIACEKSEFCDDCKFAERYGVCGNDDALVTDFYDLLTDIINCIETKKT